MLAASLSSAALASRLRLSGTLALDPDMSVRGCKVFRRSSRELVQENAPSASVDEIRTGGTGYRFVHLANRPSAAEGFGFANAFVQSPVPVPCSGAISGGVQFASLGAPQLTRSPESRYSGTPVPVPVPVVFDLRFGTSGNLNFDAANFSRHGDTANGVLTVDVPGPTVRPALWLPIIAGIPLAFLRSDLEVPIFSVGPIALLIGGVDGQYWRSDSALRMWSCELDWT